MSYSPVPATDDVLCRYVAFLAQRLSYSSIAQYLNIIRILHLENGYPNPLQTNFALSCLLRGVRRSLGDSSNRKDPITTTHLLQILSGLDVQKPQDSAIWAAALVAFFCMLRRSNVLPPSLTAFQKSRHLLRQDVALQKDGAIVTIRWTKTIQFQERELRIPLARFNSALCPYLAIAKHFTLTHKAPPDGPAFVCSNAPPFQPLTSAVFIHRIKRILGEHGNDASQFSGHSFRRGGASYAYQNGVALHTIKQLGDWKSDVYSKYIFDSLESFKKKCMPMFSAANDEDLKD